MAFPELRTSINSKDIPGRGSDSDENEQQGPINDVTPECHQSRFEVGCDYKQFHSELMVVKENLNKIQIRTKTKN